MPDYQAITIGPIIQTLQMTSTPAGLWASSYLFSALAREICLDLRAHGAKIVVPWFPEDEEKHTRGVGLFPDHIIFEAIDALDIDQIKLSAVEKLAALLTPKGKKCDNLLEYLCNYLQIHVIAFSADGNPIAASNRPLSHGELKLKFTAKETANPLQIFLEGSDKNFKNQNIKESVLIQDYIQLAWSLWVRGKHEKIRLMKDIANDSITPKLKPQVYYAIIQADGDNIGKVICADDTDITAFSKKLWHYSEKAAKLVQEYGGVPIYAGGDDLLCIVPVLNSKDEIVFDLVAKLRKAFHEAFKGTNPEPTLSLGIAIHYYKYPLYESFGTAINLLYRAKAANGNDKNTLSLRLEKHSGQAVQLDFKDGSESKSLKKIMDMLPTIRAEHAGEQLLHSIMQHLRVFEALFATAFEKEQVPQAFKHTFDDNSHKDKKIVKEDMPELLNICYEESTSTKESSKAENALAKIDSLLRLLKFFVETTKEEGQ